MAPPLERRKAPFVLDQAKFTTQSIVTYFVLLLFACVVAVVFAGDDQAERSTVLQAIINFAMLALGYWLGASKTANEKDATLSRIAEGASPSQARAANTMAVEVAGDMNIKKDPPK